MTLGHAVEKPNYLFPLYSGIWDATTIEVCWENPQSSNNTERQWVQSKVASTWENNSALIFTGWQKCTNTSKGIRILIAEAGPHVKKLGN
jgi:hypothetical protein